jgi:long-chain fatty acid transport protein
MKKSVGPIGVLVLCTLGLALSPAAWAGGYFLVPRGARNLGRGGASVASAADMTAFWVNPARLAHLRGVQLHTDVGLGLWQIQFQRATDPDIDPRGFPESRNIAPPLASPSLFGGWDAGQDWFEASLGVYGPYAGDLGFSAAGPQRYSLVYMNMLEITYQLAVAFRPLDWLAIGAAFQVHDVQVTQTIMLSAYTGVNALSRRESGSDEIYSEIEAAGHFNPSGLFGIWFGPTEWLDFGIAAQLPVNVKAKGQVSVDLPSDNALLRDAWVDGDQVRLSFALPTIVRGGLAVRLPRRVEVELNVAAEFWRPHRDLAVELDDVAVRDVEGGLDLTMDDITIAQDWQTSLSLALGAEWEALPQRLRVRGGAYYDSGAVPDHTLSVAWVDSNKVGLSLGLSVEFWKMGLDLAYSHVFFLPRKINDSEVTQINPIRPEEPELAAIVGNGTYRSSLDVIAASLRAQF